MEASPVSDNSRTIDALRMAFIKRCGLEEFENDPQISSVSAHSRHRRRQHPSPPSTKAEDHVDWATACDELWHSRDREIAPIASADEAADEGDDHSDGESESESETETDWMMEDAATQAYDEDGGDGGHPDIGDEENKCGGGGEHEKYGDNDGGEKGEGEEEEEEEEEFESMPDVSGAVSVLEGLSLPPDVMVELISILQKPGGATSLLQVCANQVKELCHKTAEGGK
jgi:hypothetical protein